MPFGEDEFLDQFMEDRINGGYGEILDSMEAELDATLEPHDEFDGDFDHEDVTEDYDESMDGDFDTGMASAGFGTDEDYGYFGAGEDW